jgi:pyruvate dehydrogenase E2 component (dihydrolipoamide acetyltransferase)
MAEQLLFSRLGITMEEGAITKWLKNVGDHISVGEVVCEIETDKTVQEWECNYRRNAVKNIGTRRGKYSGHGRPVVLPENTFLIPITKVWKNRLYRRRNAGEAS